MGSVFDRRPAAIKVLFARSLKVLVRTGLLGGGGLAVWSALVGAPAWAQDLTQGKTPAQLFAGDCAACHKSPQGLAKQNDARALAGFLREHYTTKPEMAEALAVYVVSSGRGQPAGQILDRTSPSADRTPKPRATATTTNDGPKWPNTDGSKPPGRSRAPTTALGEQPRPSEPIQTDASKPTPKSSAATLNDGDKPSSTDIIAPDKPDKSADDDASKGQAKPAARVRRATDDASSTAASTTAASTTAEDSKGKRKGSARDDSKKLNAYARSGSTDKDEAAESMVKLRDYASAGQGVPTVPNMSLKPTIGSTPAESGTKDVGPQDKSTDVGKTGPTEDAKPATGQTPTTQGEPSTSGSDDQVKPIKPRKSNDGKSADGGKPRRTEPPNQPMSPTAFFGRLFSGGTKPQD